MSSNQHKTQNIWPLRLGARDLDKTMNEIVLPPGPRTYGHQIPPYRPVARRMRREQIDGLLRSNAKIFADLEREPDSLGVGEALTEAPAVRDDDDEEESDEYTDSESSDSGDDVPMISDSDISYTQPTATTQVGRVAASSVGASTTPGQQVKPIKRRGVARPRTVKKKASSKRRKAEASSTPGPSTLIRARPNVRAIPEAEKVSRRSVRFADA